MKLGLNLEFARSAELGVADAIKSAADAGYRRVEAYIYTPVQQPINSHLEVVTRTPYHHIHSSNSNAGELRALLESVDCSLSAVDAHCSLLLPQVGVPFLKGAIDFAAEVQCPFVVSDEGPLAVEWMDLDRSFDVMCFALEPVIAHAAERSVHYAMELHNALTARPEYLMKLLARFGPAELGVNFDTGNSFLAGNDPVDYLRQVAGRVVHVHVKDIPASQLHERGKVTGTRVGVAAGDGEVDLSGIVEVLREVEYRGVLSVECDTLDQAKRSLLYLQTLIDDSASAEYPSGD